MWFAIRSVPQSLKISLPRSRSFATGCVSIVTCGIFAPSAEDDLRTHNDALSGRYSKLKARDLPSVNRILRETRQQMMDLQGERGDHDKSDYLDAMSGLYHKKAIYLRYKAEYEEELRSIKDQIRENKRKLKELKGDKEEPKKTKRPKQKGPKNGKGKGKAKVRTEKKDRS